MKKMIFSVLLAAIFASQATADFYCAQDENAPPLRIKRHCSERSFGTTYTNNSSKTKGITIVAIGMGYRPSIDLRVDGRQIGDKTQPNPIGGYYTEAVSALVEPGASYSANVPGVRAAWTWSESEID